MCLGWDRLREPAGFFAVFPPGNVDLDLLWGPLLLDPGIGHRVNPSLREKCNSSVLVLGLADNVLHNPYNYGKG